MPVVEHLSLAPRSPDAVHVLVPTRVPDPAHSGFEVLYHPPRRQSGGRIWP